MMSVSKFIFFLIVCSNFEIYVAEEENSLMSVLKEKVQYKLGEMTNLVVKWLEDFNDKHLGHSEFGRILHYEELKPKFGMENARNGKSMKKMGMALIPLVFHVGATSTWMLLTSIMAVKAVAIGLVLLVFKIAVSSAKVASFFTALKAKHGHHHEYSWTPHSEHHGYDRSLPDIGSYYPADWSSFTPESSDHDVATYKTIPMYKNHAPYSYKETDYSEESKKNHSL